MVHASHPPPPLRDHKLELCQLEPLARTFDAIGDEIGGARYPAVAFVQWLADEDAANRPTPAARKRRSSLDSGTPSHHSAIFAPAGLPEGLTQGSIARGGTVCLTETDRFSFDRRC
jgi:hypothetical protein